MAGKSLNFTFSHSLSSAARLACVAVATGLGARGGMSGTAICGGHVKTADVSDAARPLVAVVTRLDFKIKASHQIEGGFLLVRFENSFEICDAEPLLIKVQHLFLCIRNFTRVKISNNKSIQNIKSTRSY